MNILKIIFKRCSWSYWWCSYQNQLSWRGRTRTIQKSKGIFFNKCSRDLWQQPQLHKYCSSMVWLSPWL